MTSCAATQPGERTVNGGAEPSELSAGSRAEADRRQPKFSLPPLGSSHHLPCFGRFSARLGVKTQGLRYRFTFILAFKVKQP